MASALPSPTNWQRCLVGSKTGTSPGSHCRCDSAQSLHFYPPSPRGGVSADPKQHQPRNVRRELGKYTEPSTSVGITAKPVNAYSHSESRLWSTRPSWLHTGNLVPRSLMATHINPFSGTTHGRSKSLQRVTWKPIFTTGGEKDESPSV